MSLATSAWNVTLREVTRARNGNFPPEPANSSSGGNRLGRRFRETDQGKKVTTLGQTPWDTSPSASRKKLAWAAMAVQKNLVSDSGKISSRGICRPPGKSVQISAPLAPQRPFPGHARCDTARHNAPEFHGGRERQAGAAGPVPPRAGRRRIADLQPLPERYVTRPCRCPHAPGTTDAATSPSMRK